MSADLISSHNSQNLTNLLERLRPLRLMKYKRVISGGIGVIMMLPKTSFDFIGASTGLWERGQKKFATWWKRVVCGRIGLIAVVNGWRVVQGGGMSGGS